FFQAEDGIRDFHVTGVQTCALPILADFNPETDAIEYEKLREVDQFILVRLNNLVKTVKDSYEKYEFMNIYHAVNNFCTLDLSSFYMDFAKDVLYIEAKDNYERRAMQTVMYESVEIGRAHV